MVLTDHRLSTWVYSLGPQNSITFLSTPGCVGFTKLSRMTLSNLCLVVVVILFWISGFLCSKPDWLYNSRKSCVLPIVQRDSNILEGISGCDAPLWFSWYTSHDSETLFRLRYYWLFWQCLITRKKFPIVCRIFWYFSCAVILHHLPVPKSD